MISKKYALLFVLFLFQSVLWGQISPKEKDSLLKLVKNTTGEERLQILDKLNDYYLTNNLDSAFYYSDILLKVAKKTGNQLYEARAYQHKATYNVYKAKYYPAMDTINMAIDILEHSDLTNDLADSYKILAGIYYQIDNYKKAIEISFKTLKNYEKENNHKGIIASLNNIALLNRMLDNYQQSLSYYKKALRYIDQHKVKEHKSFIYGNMGVVYKYLNKLDSALYYYRKAEYGYLQAKNFGDLASNYFNIGNLYALQNNIDSARFYYKKASRLAETMNKSLLKDIYDRQGKIYLKNGKLDKAIPYFNKTLALSKAEHSWYGLQLANFRLYQTYKTKKDWKKSLKHLEDFVDYQDSLDIEKNKVSIANLESKYENEKNKIRIKALKAKQSYNKKINRIVIISLVLVVLVLLLLLRNYAHRRKRNLLEKQLLEVEKERLNQDVNYKNRQLTSQALLMMQKNNLLDDILKTISENKAIKLNSSRELTQLKRKLKKSIHSDKDWELFKHYFEEINKDFFKKLHEKNAKLTPSELKLSALIKLRFSIKETASLLNITPDSVKTARHLLRKKLGLKTSENIYDYLNNMV